MRSARGLTMALVIMKPKAIRFDDLLHAFDFVSAGQPFENEAYLCIETGDFHWYSEFGDLDEPLPEGVEDSERYIPIPHKDDLGLGRRLVFSFVEAELPENLEDVWKMFRRKGAYSRFKSLLERRAKLQQWYEYEERRTKEALLEWCQENGVHIQD